MANKVYPKYIVDMMTGAGADLSSAGVNVKAVLVDTGDYTYSDSHQYLSDIPSGARVATSGNMTGKAVSSTDGAWDMDDFTFTGVSGDQSEAVVWYIDTGSAATSRLIYYCDSGITGAPVTPNNGDIAVTIPEGGLFTP